MPPFTVVTLAHDSPVLVSETQRTLARNWPVFVPSPAPLPTLILLREDFGLPSSLVISSAVGLPIGFLPQGLSVEAVWPVEERLGLRLGAEQTRETVMAPLTPLAREVVRAGELALRCAALPLPPDRSALWPAIAWFKGKTDGVLLITPAPGMDPLAPRDGLTEVRFMTDGTAAIVSAGGQHPVEVARSFAEVGLPVGISADLRVECSSNGRLPAYLRQAASPGTYAIDGVVEPASIAVTLDRSPLLG